MRIDKEDAEKKDGIAVKKENKDDDNASVTSTVAAGNEEISANRLPPEDPTSAENGPPELPPLRLPKPDDVRAEERTSAEGSASKTPERGKGGGSNCREEKARKDRQGGGSDCREEKARKD